MSKPRTQDERLFAYAERAQAEGCGTPAEVAAWLRGRRIRHQGQAVTVETVSRILEEYTRSERMAGGSRIVVRRTQP